MQFVLRHDTIFLLLQTVQCPYTFSSPCLTPFANASSLTPSQSHIIGDDHILQQGDTLAHAGLLPVCPRAVLELVLALRHHSIPAAVLDSVVDTLGGDRILALLVGQEV